MNITPDECEARIKRDPKLLDEALRENDFAGFLAGSYSPMDNDTLEFGERVKDFINESVKAAAEYMAKEMNESANDEFLDAPERNQAAWIMRGAR